MENTWKSGKMAKVKLRGLNFTERSFLVVTESRTS